MGGALDRQFELPRSDFSGFDTDFKGDRLIAVVFGAYIEGDEPAFLIIFSRGLCYRLDHNCSGASCSEVDGQVVVDWGTLYASEQSAGLRQSRCGLAACSSALRGKANHCGSRIGRSKAQAFANTDYNTCLSLWPMVLLGQG